jgi:hypothetical protein
VNINISTKLHKDGEEWEHEVHTCTYTFHVVVKGPCSIKIIMAHKNESLQFIVFCLPYLWAFLVLGFCGLSLIHHFSF